MPKMIFYSVFCAVVLLGLSCDKRDERKTKAAEGVEIPPEVPYEIIDDAPQQEKAVFDNRPVAYGSIGTGEYALLARDTHSRIEAEEESRRLRRDRVNNYIFADENENYYVLIGNFPSERQAKRAASRLQKFGHGRFKLFTLDSTKVTPPDSAVIPEQPIPDGPNP